MRSLFLIFSAMILSNSMHAQRNQISWHEQESLQRGFITDYSGFQKHTDRNTGMEYYLANDSLNLYVLFVARNEMVQGKLLRVGLEIEFEIPDRKEKIARLTLPPDQVTSQPAGRGSQLSDLSGRKAAYVSRATQFFTEGFEKTTGQLALGRWGGLSARIRHDSLALYYEIKIPLQELFGNDFVLREISRQDIILTAAIEAIPLPPSERSRDNMPPADDRFGSPTSRRPGGSMYPGDYNRVPYGGPRYMPVDGSTDLLFSKQRIKRKFRLAPGKIQ